MPVDTLQFKFLAKKKDKEKQFRKIFITEWLSEASLQSSQKSQIKSENSDYKGTVST